MEVYKRQILCTPRGMLNLWDRVLLKGASKSSEMIRRSKCAIYDRLVEKKSHMKNNHLLIFFKEKLDLCQKIFQFKSGNQFVSKWPTLSIPLRTAEEEGDIRDESQLDEIETDLLLSPRFRVKKTKLDSAKHPAVSEVIQASFACNEPPEDFATVVDLDYDGGYLLAGLVIDGHGGSAIARKVRDWLPSILKKNLDEQKNKNEAYKQAFEETDNKLKEALLTAVETFGGDIVRGGACCTLVAVEKNKWTAASAGDSQALIAKRDKPIQITHISSADEPEEQERLKKLHPHEAVVSCKSIQIGSKSSIPRSCYVKGRLQPTKAFGDFHLKDMKFIDNNIKSNIKNNPEYKFTPPYIDCTPHMKTGVLDKDDKYIFIATDGIWDFMSQQEVVSTINQNLTISPLKAVMSLYKNVVEKAAKQTRQGLTPRQVVRLPPRERRQYMDDTTMILIVLKN